MKSCLNAATLRQDLAFEELVRVAGRAGFKGVELRYPAWVDYAAERGLDGLRALFDEAGVQPASFGYPASLMRLDSWDSDLTAAEQVVDLARQLGVGGGMSVLPWRRGSGRLDPRLRGLPRNGGDPGRRIHDGFAVIGTISRR